MIPLEAILASLYPSNNFWNSSSVLMGTKKLCCRKASYCAGVMVTWVTKLWVLHNEFASCHGTLNFVAAPRFMENLWTPAFVCLHIPHESLMLVPIYKRCVTGGPPTNVCEYPCPTSQFPWRNRMYWTESYAFKIPNLNTVNMMDIKTSEIGATLLLFITRSLHFWQR